MVSLNRHIYRCGPSEDCDVQEDELQQPARLRKQIEPWLTGVFQSEHLSLLVGSGFTNAIATAAGGRPVDMSKCEWKENLDLRSKVQDWAGRSAAVCGRGSPNIEDQLGAAMQLEAGLRVMQDPRASSWSAEIDTQLKSFMESILDSERSIQEAESCSRDSAEDLLVSFLLSFASRTATRERLNLFTTNYDRVIEHGCDLAGLHMLDRFVGSLSPVFRASRLNIDLHYNPPGMRGEPRYLEGVMRLSKIHGSVDWRWENGELRRYAVPFGAAVTHPDIPREPSGSVMIFPNAAKDTETLNYPYSELFRDFAAAVCRPNSSLVIYGYGFGDDHVNRVIKDMLTIPSTHLVIIAWDKTDPAAPDDASNGSRWRLTKFCQDVGKESQTTLLLGSHFGDLATLVHYYLPKPAIDSISMRVARLMELRGENHRAKGRSDEDQTN